MSYLIDEFITKNNLKMSIRGYERAKKFIDEFNKKMGLNLSTEEIDEAINRDYTNGERWEPVLKTYVNQDGKERSYWTFEDVAKKEKSR